MSTTPLDAPWLSTADVEMMQLERLRRMLARCARSHPVYRATLQEMSLAGRDMGSLSDFATFPITTKKSFIDSAEEYRLEPDPSRIRDYALADVAYTAGTTSGQPTPIYQTGMDLRAILFAQLRMAHLRGMRRGDTVANLYPLAPLPHGGWIRPTQAASVLGAPVVTATGGARVGEYPITRSLTEVAELVVETDPTVLWGVPSYLVRLYREVIRIDGRVPSVRLIAVSGETCTTSLRSTLIDLARSAGADSPFVSDSLGASELQFSLVECPEGGGFHNPAPELALLQSIGDDGMPVPDGQPGRLALTHLDRYGTVLLKYLVGDRVVLTRDPCPGCGWLGERIVEHLGREGNFTKVRGNLISIDAAHAAVSTVDGVVDHRITLSTSDDMDVLDIALAVEHTSNRAEVERQVLESVRRATGVRPNVEALDQRDPLWAADEAVKPKRFLNLRDRSEEGET